MTQDELGSVAEAYKQIQEAEKQADQLEKMLENEDATIDSILNDAERLQKDASLDTEKIPENEE